MSFEGYVGENSIVKTTRGNKKSQIYNNCRVYDSILNDNCTIGDFSTVRETDMGRNSTIQRYCDIWRLKLGRYSCIGRVSTIQATEIGAFCALSWNLRIGGDDHDYNMLSTHPFWHDTSWGIINDDEFSKEYREFEYREPCIIGNDVWVGAGVTVCRNVRIGNGCVIGAGTVVTRDVEPYSIVVGTPGRIIKKRFDDNTIERLEKIQWWNFSEEIIRDNINMFKNHHINNEVLDKLERLKDE